MNFKVLSLDQAHALLKAMDAMPSPGIKPPSTYLPGVHAPTSPLRSQKGKKGVLAKTAKPGATGRPWKGPAAAPAGQPAAGSLKAKMMEKLLAKDLSGGSLRTRQDKPTRRIEPITAASAAAPKQSAPAPAPKQAAPQAAPAPMQSTGGRRRSEKVTMAGVKPISNSEAAANLSAGKHVEKALRTIEQLMKGCDPDMLKAPKRKIKKSLNQESTMSNKYEDLFKSELGTDDTLIDCPHCEHPITKSEVMAKAAPDSNTVVDDNDNGENYRGKKSGKNSQTPKRGVSGATAQNHGMPGAHDVNKSQAPLVRGSAFVQYVDTGADEALAKAIAEGSLGQGAITSQPIDKHNSRR